MRRRLLNYLLVITVSEELCVRVKKYLTMVRKALSSLSVKSGYAKDVLRIVELAKLYLEDSQYYYGKGDYGTALACVSYAEGLLDALRMLGHVDVRWVREPVRRVFVAGTFDLIHPGHIRYLREADRLGLVYAVIARDENVRRFKGKSPIMPEDLRLEMVSSIKYVYKAMLGDPSDMFKPVEEVKPDVILLGPDQPVDELSLTEELARRGLKTKVVRLKSRCGPKLSSTSEIIKEVIRRYCR